MTDKLNTNPSESELIYGGSDKDFLVVGIGASAGGIEALKNFFMQVPANSSMAYVVILHLSPDHDSQLAEVLQTASTIPVTQVKKRVKVEPNHVYVISPNKSLAINDGHLDVLNVTSSEVRRAPVDMFFRTLADSHGPRAVSVVLSGTGANGSMGMKRVKEMGGCSIVQDPQEAEYNDMPLHSLATGLVDYVLPVAEIPRQIIAYKNQLKVIQIPEAPPEPAMMDMNALSDIFTQLRVRTGHDFSNYKRATVTRRIARRMGVQQLPDLPSYSQFIRDHPVEANALLKDLLISVTNFFRDPRAFEKLARDVIPKLFEGKTGEDQVRVWAAGCATGEEAYTLAMLLTGYSMSLPNSPQLQIFATDIDEDAIAAARDGYYTLNDAADVPGELLDRYFLMESGGYRVRREVRERVLFAVHNVIKDPPFGHVDLVTCRNLLIYLNHTAQRRVMDVLHFALNPGGYLMLGSSESIDGASDLYTTVDKEHHIYQGRAVETRFVFPVPDGPLIPRLGKLPESRGIKESRSTNRSTYSELHQRLLEQYAPPSVVVNENYDIVHMSETAGRYMELKGGELSSGLLSLIRPELRLELRGALYQATQKGTNIQTRPVKLQVGHETKTIEIHIRPVLSEEDKSRGFILVLFEEAREGTAEGVSNIRTVSEDDEPIARQLEQELLEAKAQLSSTIEHHELQREELKASNEELQAMNEEMRSAAEELETSKEELQSINEELTTVNQELKIKIEELAHSNDDFKNLINSTQIGTLFLDRNLRVKLFTQRACDIFNLIPSDIGRQLSDITSKLNGDLIADAEKVLERLHMVEREVRTKDSRTFLMQIAPYRTNEDRISGVVATFLDITERKQAEQRLRESEERLRLTMESVEDFAILTTNQEGYIESWTVGAERTFGYSEAEAIGQNVAIIFTPEDRERGVPEREMAIAREEGRAADERWHIRKDGTRFYVSGVLAPLRDADRAVIGFARVARDLTEQRRAQEELSRSHDELEERVRERTVELAKANESLRGEISERIRTERGRVLLLRQIVRAQEDERRRIARDIHDHLGQQMTALRLNLESLEQAKIRPEDLRQKLEQTKGIAERLDADVDFLAWELRPAALDDIGLAEALSKYIQEWSKHSGVEAEFHTSRIDEVRLQSETETNLYRITQEALNNTMKYARATRVDVLLERREHQVVLIIEDNGVGFNPGTAVSEDDHKGMGLIGMRERATLVGGTLEIESKIKEGTTIFARVPIKFLDEEGGSAT